MRRYCLSLIYSIPAQLTIGNPVRTIRRHAQMFAPIFLVLAVIAGEPDGLAVALKGQDVTGDAIQKPATINYISRVWDHYFLGTAFSEISTSVIQTGRHTR